MMKDVKHILLPVVALLICSCAGDVKIVGDTGEEPDIFPDYKEVTIPVNIAPLNFVLNDAEGADTRLFIEGAQQRIVVKGDDGSFDIPLRKWKKLLEKAQGEKLTLTIARKYDDGWKTLRPFTISVVADKVDPYIAYRLIAPGYIVWKKMGIYQRCVEDFTQSPIFENKLTTYNCVNCHMFQSRNPERIIFHARNRHGGMVYADKNKIEKLNTKTDKTITPLVYGFWHPAADYVAFSTNQTRLVNFMHNENYMEVYDFESDVVVYNTVTHEIMSCPQLSSSKAFETFPAFSPDGKSLYFCSADSVAPLPERYLETHYSLCRIDFDAATGTFGNHVDTLYNARQTKMSVSFPRISPDGRYLCFTLHKYGNFSIWQRDADLCMIDLSTGQMQMLDDVNSQQSESYHSWSSNNRWMVFSSRRVDGLYTRPFFTYIDKQGHAHKPFMLPQRNPRKFYSELMYSYNIPEFIEGKVTLSQQAIARFMRNTEPERVIYKE